MGISPSLHRDLPSPEELRPGRDCLKCVSFETEVSHTLPENIATRINPIIPADRFIMNFLQSCVIIILTSRNHTTPGSQPQKTSRGRNSYTTGHLLAIQV